jgi:hypothetical protein
MYLPLECMSTSYIIGQGYNLYCEAEGVLLEVSCS